MLNTTSFSTTYTDSLARFFRFGTRKESRGGKAQLRKEMRDAYKQFSAMDSLWTNSLFDLHFLQQYGETTVAEYLNGSLPRNQAAVELANAWEDHLMPPNTRMRKVLRADAAMAADRYLS